MMCQLLILMSLTVLGKCNIDIEFFELTSTDNETSIDSLTLLCRSSAQSSVNEDPLYRVAGYAIYRKNQTSDWTKVADLTSGTLVDIYDVSVLSAIGNVQMTDYHKTFIQLLLPESHVSVTEFRCDITYYNITEQENAKEVSKILKFDVKTNINRNNDKLVNESQLSALYNNTFCSCYSPVKEKDMLIEKIVKDIMSIVKASIQDLINKTIASTKAPTQMASKEETNHSRNDTADYPLLQFINEHFSAVSNVVKSISKIDSMLREHKALFTNISSNRMILQEISADEINTTWPNGTYALFKTDGGCPDVLERTWSWGVGFRKFHTETDNNGDDHSEPIHLAQPLKVKESNLNFFYLHYCVRDTKDGNGKDWPRGTYCINKVGSTCPHGFESGGFKIDEENNNYAGTSGGYPLRTGAEFFLKFCCRHDGNHKVPIVLPPYSPFYLGKFGGECQTVFAMKHVEEYVSFDTEDSNNLDQMFFPHPDINSFRSGVNFTLCYYYA